MVYEGNAFVAWIDLQGFKYLMNRDEGWDALKKFYESGGYWLFDNAALQIPGLFFSDSAILWVDESEGLDGFITLLSTVQAISWSVVNKNLLPTSSISFGEFKYGGVTKIGTAEQFPFYGKAFVEAFKDNSKKDVWAGLCRILKNENYDDEIERWLESPDEGFVISKNSNSYTYFWMLNDNSQIIQLRSKLNQLDTQLEEKRYEDTSEILKATLKETESFEVLKLINDS